MDTETNLHYRQDEESGQGIATGLRIKVQLPADDAAVLARFSAVAAADRFLWPSKELHPKVGAKRHLQYANSRKTANRQLINKLEAASQPPRLALAREGVEPAEINGKPAALTQDEHLRVAADRLLRSTPASCRAGLQVCAGERQHVGRRVEVLTSQQPACWIRGALDDAREGQHRLVADDGSTRWLRLSEEVEAGRLRFQFHGCGCPGVADGLCKEDLLDWRQRGHCLASKAELDVTTFEHLGLKSVLVRGARTSLVPPSLVDEARCAILALSDYAIVKLNGCYAGDRALYFADTDYPSSSNIRMGVCEECGIDSGGDAVCRLASYVATHQNEEWQNVRHVIPSVAMLGKRLFKRLHTVLSAETLQHGCFNCFDIRINEGWRNSKTTLHTDTVLEDTNGEPRDVLQVSAYVTCTCS